MGARKQNRLGSRRGQGMGGKRQSRGERVGHGPRLRQRLQREAEATTRKTAVEGGI